MTNIITRFAPSPTGHLHLGGARTAIFNWLFARHYGGKFFLRIEDTDLERSKPEYTKSILASMAWLGLDYNDNGLIYQTRRFDLYNQYIDKLLLSEHAYWCECSPEEVENMREQARLKGKKPRYNGCCRDKGLAPKPGAVVRLKAPLSGVTVVHDLIKGEVNFNNAELDDMVLRRSDGSSTYNLAVVVDDLDMKISHVIRGDDHLSNTPKQILIYQALNAAVPVFAHVPMILGPDKQKLSKRHGAKAVIEYEQDGLLPEALINYLVRLGWSHGDDEIFSLDKLKVIFPKGKFSAAASAFDPDKLMWLNAYYLKELSPERLYELCLPFIENLQIEKNNRTEKINLNYEKAELTALLQLFKDRANNLKQLAKSMLFLFIQADDLNYEQSTKDKTLTPETKQHLKNLKQKLVELSEFNTENIHQLIQHYVEEQGIKFKNIGPALRLSLVGQMAGPDLSQIMYYLGKKESLNRLDKATRES